MRGVFAILILGTLAVNSARAEIADPTALERKAREVLAGKLNNLTQSLDLKEGKFQNGNAQGLDANTGNPTYSYSTIHYYVQSTCREWVGDQYCNSWLDPFIAEHGLGGNFSPLEGVVAQEWQQNKNVDGDGQYKIWQISRNGGGSNVDQDGKLDRSGITDWRLLPDIRKKIDDIGTKTAQHQISLTYDDAAPKGGQAQVLPNMESLRVMASSWTKMFRNRLVANLADMRTGDKGIEFLHNEEMPDCESYVQAMKSRQEKTKVEERLQEQAKLDYETLPLDLQSRYKACVAMRKASVRNPAGDETVDKWKTRLNIMAIDHPDRDLASVPRPNGYKLTREDISSEITDYSDGGLRVSRKKRMTNREQLNSYNNNVEQAAAGMKEVAMRSQNIIDNSGYIRGRKIKLGQAANSVKINGMTAEMAGELANTSLKNSVLLKGGPQLEDNATQLATTKR